jgi:hypothetical protein
MKIWEIKKRAKEFHQRAYKAFKSLENLEIGNNIRIRIISNEADEVLKKIKELDKSK